MSTTPTQEWRLDVVEDVAVPGWYLVPPEMDDEQRRGWVNGCATDLQVLLDSDDPDIPAVEEEALLRVLEAGLEVRDASPSLAIFQVWPVRLAAAVLCHVNILASADLPRWAEMGDVALFPIDAPHVGPGLQCTVRRREVEDGEEVELASIHYVFDDGETTLMLSLDESLAVLIGAALPGFVALKDVLAMVRSDGVRFASVAPSGVLAEDAWPMEDPS